ncbi:MAG: CAP domain-containing protein [Myxococcaceae bacterium]|nr:CAP domain-containing protein [Myxococcaceae bacterium]
MFPRVAVCCFVMTACTGTAISELGPPPLDDSDGGTAGGEAGGDAGGGAAGGGSTAGGSTAGGSTAGGASAGGAAGGMVVTGPCSMTGGTRVEQVCRRWRCDRMDLSEGTWSGTVSPCAAGALNDTGRNNALKLINLYRFLADLPPVTLDAAKNQSAQECALMMDANNQLSHSPPASWTCYSASGAQAAGRSNICSTRAVRCIDMYMSDFGNATTIGHRRWFLSNQLGPIGIGGTTGGSCHHVIGGSGTSTKPWLAYPPPGPVPLEAIAIPGNPSVDSTGWTVQSYASTWSLVGATVTVTEGGQNRPVTVTQLGDNYGSRYAIRFNPVGWTTQAGRTYDVTVSAPALSTPITYSVQVVSCP